VQFAGMKQHGTRIVLYNLWEDDQGQLELDFDADPYVCELVIDQFIVFNGFHTFVPWLLFLLRNTLSFKRFVLTTLMFTNNRTFKSEEQIVMRKRS
jgi:hypothetical protein